MASGPITSWQIDGKTMETVTDFTFLGSKPLQRVTATMKLKDTCFLEKSYDQPRQYIKSGDITLLTKVHVVKAMFFSSSHTGM